MQYRLMFETPHLEPIDDYDVFEYRRQALAAFRAAVSDPPQGVGSVYLVADDGDVATVIVGHYFINTTDK